MGLENQQKIGAEEYSKILRGLELDNLYLSGAKLTLLKENLAVGSTIKIENRALFRILEDKSIEVSHSYKLRVINKESKKISVRILCNFILVYSSKETFSESFFNIFKDRNLPINTWPYFREYVSNSISRMNIPPLVLPLLKRNLVKKEPA